MSNVDKMCLRMMVVCGLPLVIAFVLAKAASLLLNAFARLGTPTPPVDVAWLVSLTGAVVCVVLLLIQAMRIWRWKEGKCVNCSHCGCLLSGVCDGRWGLSQVLGLPDQSCGTMTTSVMKMAGHASRADTAQS